jgi:hypothetical protein
MSVPGLYRLPRLHEVTEAGPAQNKNDEMVRLILPPHHKHLLQRNCFNATDVYGACLGTLSKLVHSYPLQFGFMMCGRFSSSTTCKAWVLSPCLTNCGMPFPIPSLMRPRREWASYVFDEGLHLKSASHTTRANLRRLFVVKQLSRSVQAGPRIDWLGTHDSWPLVVGEPVCIRANPMIRWRGRQGSSKASSKSK